MFTSESSADLPEKMLHKDWLAARWALVSDGDDAPTLFACVEWLAEWLLLNGAQWWRELTGLAARPSGSEVAPPLLSVREGGGSGRVEEGEGSVGKGRGSKRGRQLTTILTPVGPMNLRQVVEGDVVYRNTSHFDTNQPWIQNSEIAQATYKESCIYMRFIFHSLVLKCTSNTITQITQIAHSLTHQ